MYNKDNFYAGTKATFKGCKVPRVEPDYISYSSSGRVSSRYWYTKDGVIRASDHWSLYRYLNDGKNRNYLRKELKELPDSRWMMFYYDKEKYSTKVLSSSNLESKGCLNISSCFWILKSNNSDMDKITLDWNNSESIVLAGFCKWDNFKKNRI